MLKKIGRLLGLGILLLAVTHFVRAQQAADTAPVPVDDGAPPSPLAPQPVPFLVVDPVTWMVTWPEADLPENAWLNFPEEIETRRLAALELSQPFEYRRLFPLTPEEEQAQSDSLDRILNPTKYVAWFDAQKTPEQRQLEVDAQFAILHPGEYAAWLAQQQADEPPPQDPNPLHPPEDFPPPDTAPTADAPNAVPVNDSAAPATPNQN